MIPGLFGNIRVIDLTTDVAGPFATKLFADYGADVIKVEPISGDISRQMGPFHEDDPHPEKSLSFLFLNCNKRGITLNLETRLGQKILRELIKDADLLIENNPPGHMEKLGLGYTDLEKINPNLVMTSITPFGQTGPYKDFSGNDLIYYAFGGQMYISGAYDREPLKHGTPQSLYLGGMVAAYSTAGALFARRALGSGQYIDLSLSEVMAADQFQTIVRYGFSGEVTRRSPKNDAGDPKGTTFNGIVPAKDGYIRLSASPPNRLYPRSGGTPWKEYADILGEPELGEQLENANNTTDRDKILLPVISDIPKFEYFHNLMTKDWNAAVVQTPEDLSNCPHLEERNYFTEIEHPVVGKIRFPGEIIRFPESPWNLRLPAPLLGQHNSVVYGEELGYSENEIVQLKQMGSI
ncbi:MAG: formyl-CoA transferase/CoA:oxalate CoA-transferase [Chloroflexi bacterium]|jgi:crotonobetainyl-CoA:carnitine CoA-transferase CaiB-like acyl-CoA transferase|nr:MAG: formyl-CoA transferase/CoA:oxalate CoA-transferase [Chloroflexota bacterium]